MVTRKGFMNDEYNVSRVTIIMKTLVKCIENGNSNKKNSLVSPISLKENKNYSKHPKGTSFSFQNKDYIYKFD